MSSVRLIYFAWIRERIGRAEDAFEVPPSVINLGQLLDWLAARGPGYKAALSDRRAIRMAMDQEFAGPDQALTPGCEVALFPPVTGG
jgi:molybdopterin synthase sulfur carrier subunit